ncbi:MAG: efflux RND transporter periplasmic adaptor subunit [Campylobacterales bacterium]|nr:efflux RND transporter periplasmic adaptor subunit [Campylobacterales bacterium]
MRNKTRAALLLSTAILFGAASLQANEPKPSAAQPPMVDVYKVIKTAQMPISLEYPARLKSIRSAKVVARVSGVLMQKMYEEGSFVKKGSLLYTIEPDVYAALVHEREADMALQEALYKKAARDWERAQALYSDKALSKQEYDGALSAFETAKAGVNAAKAKLASANVDLGYTQVKAPISGIAGVKETDLGNVVSAGTPLLRITQSDPMHAEFSIPDVDRLKALYAVQKGRWSDAGQDGLKATLNVGGRVTEGRVDYIDPVIDANTGSVKARALFKNPDALLMQGAFGRITVTGFVRNDVVMVPQKAVLQNPMGTIVFVIDKGKAAVRPVRLGDTAGDKFIVEEGLTEGDVVIVNNFFRVKPGMDVTIDKTLSGEGK